MSASGLPCEVDALLAAHCRSCHGKPLREAAPVALLDHEDLVSPSLSSPSRFIAEVSVERMQAMPGRRMPPTGPAVPEGEIAAFESWVEDGAPEAECPESDE